MAEICLALIFVGLTMYAVLGGADFGAGFWDLTAGGAKRGGRVRGLIQRSMSPVWEANHVWLIFVLVDRRGRRSRWRSARCSRPSSSRSSWRRWGSSSRGTAFALRGQAATINEARVLGAVFALSSVVLPFFLGTVLGGIAAGEVDVADPTPSNAAWTAPSAITAACSRSSPAPTSPRSSSRATPGGWSSRASSDAFRRGRSASAS